MDDDILNDGLEETKPSPVAEVVEEEKLPVITMQTDRMGVFTPSDDQKLTKVNYFMAPASAIQKSIEQSTDEDVERGTEEEKVAYTASFINALDTCSNADDDVQPSLNHGQWKQYLQSPTEKIAMRAPRAGSQRGTLSGAAAQVRVQSASSTGSPVDIPLFISGFWLKHQTVTNRALYDFLYAQQTRKVKLGSSTVSSVFSNLSTVTEVDAINLMLDNVHYANVTDASVAGLKNRIRVTEISYLIACMSKSMWANGFEASMVCYHDVTKCAHKVTGKVDIGKMIYVNNDNFTVQQMAMLSDINTIREDKDLELYRSQFNNPQEKLVKLDNGVSLLLHVPTIADKERTGLRWINDLEATAMDAVQDITDTATLNAYISRQADLSTLLQWTHWIKEIQFTDEVSGEVTANVVDLDSIYDSMERWSGNDDYVETLTKELEGFIKQAQSIVVGMPVYKCPSCGNYPKEEDMVNGAFVAVEPMTTFFIQGSAAVS